MGLLESLFGLRCPGCGQPLNRAVLCAACEAELVPKHVPGFVYLGNYVRFGRLSRAIKYGGQTRLAAFLGQKLALGVLQAGWQLEGVTAVPTLWHRKAVRGYNQAGLLAQALAKELKLPFRPVLKRTGYSPSQTKKSLRERLELPEDTFQTSSRIGGVWLLIDDVVTTGVTFKRAKHALLTAGAAKVMGGAIAVKSPHTLGEYSL